MRVANGVAPRRQRAASDAASSPRRQRASKANLRRQLAKRVARERGAPTRKRRPRVERPREAFAATRSDGVVGDETFSWDVPPTEFPEGSYLLRIECFREGAQVHYAWHQTRIYIQR